MPQLVVYEDRHWPDLSPLTDLLPVPALAFGASTLGERWASGFTGPPIVEARAGAAGDGPPRVPAPAFGAKEPVFIANAAVLPGTWVREALADSASKLLTRGDRVVAALVTGAQVGPGIGRGEGFAAFVEGLGLPRREVDARLIEWPWNMIEWNAAAIAEDLGATRGEIRGDVHELAALYEPRHVTVEKGARIEALAVLDAREGPIRIGPGCVILPHTVVIGPCTVGEGTHLLGGSIGRSTIGPGCRIGGEVDESIWQGWANKRHHGFVGHSVIGEWSNLGALTTTSDLKNNYGTIRVHAGGRERDSGLIKLGAILGAGVKTGIGTLLPTGASIGTGSHLFGGGRYAPKYLPAFSWWDGERTSEYQLEKFLETARTAMGRRQRPLTKQHESALRVLFAAGKKEQRAG